MTQLDLEMERFNHTGGIDGDGATRLLGRPNGHGPAQRRVSEGPSTWRLPDRRVATAGWQALPRRDTGRVGSESESAVTARGTLRHKHEEDSWSKFSVRRASRIASITHRDGCASEPGVHLHLIYHFHLIYT